MKKLKGLGIQVDLSLLESTSTKEIINLLKLLKVSWIRLEINFFYYNNSQKLDRLVEFSLACHKADIVVVGLFAPFIPGTLRNVFFPHISYPPVKDYMNAFFDFVESVVKKTQKSISHWEIWNEQNTIRFWIDRPNAFEYVTFVKQVKERIHMHNRESYIISGGINGNGISRMFPLPNYLYQYVGYLPQCLDYGLADEVDYIAFHPYTFSCYVSFKTAQEILDDIKKSILVAKKKFGEHQLIISEIGVSKTLNFNISYKDIAFIYKKLDLFCRKLDIPMCIYTLVDPHKKHYSILNPDRNFGLLNYKGQKKALLSEFINYEEYE